MMSPSERRRMVRRSLAMVALWALLVPTLFYGSLELARWAWGKP